MLNLNGVHEEIRTPDRWLRRPLLYPAELRGQLSDFYIIQNIASQCKCFMIIFNNKYYDYFDNKLF